MSSLAVTRQWGTTNNTNSNGSITFPITANAKVLCANDIIYSNVDKMDAARVITILMNKLTSSGVGYAVNIDNIGAFWWFGIFSTKQN